MLRSLRVWPRSVFDPGNAVPPSTIRRRIFCHALNSRARPFGPSTRSSAARLIGLRRWLVRNSGEEKGNSTGGFYEIPIDDRGSSCASRHSERNFAFS